MPLGFLRELYQNQRLALPLCPWSYRYLLHPLQQNCSIARVILAPDSELYWHCCRFQGVERLRVVHDPLLRRTVPLMRSQFLLGNAP
jgi:hypothetical protein